MGTQQALFPNSIDEPSALSALVKSIRLRKSVDALVWLHVLWNGGQRARTRAARRVLIGAAEDGLSISAMQSVSCWYNSQRRLDLQAAAEEVIRIIKTPNWFAVPRGREYIRRWRAVELRPNPHRGRPEGTLFCALADAVRSRSVDQAAQTFWAIHEIDSWNREAMVDLLSRLALELDSPDALALAELYGANWRNLWNDNNYSGLALDVLLSGPLGDVPDSAVLSDELVLLAASIKRILSLGVTVPSWALDGIHCGGSDPRFSGMWEHMARACDAYEFFGRLDPDDDWTKLPPASASESLSVPN